MLILFPFIIIVIIFSFIINLLAHALSVTATFLDSPMLTWVTINSVEYIPFEIGLSTSQQILFVDENHLKGSIPHEIAMLGSLEKFYAHR